MVVGELPAVDLNTVRGSGVENGAGKGGAKVLGLVAVADTLRPDVVEVVQELRSIGVKKIVMLTGDHDRVAQAIGHRAGIEGQQTRIGWSQGVPAKGSANETSAF